MAKLKRDQFKFRRHDTVGAEGAEDDGDYLSTCFVDTGDLTVLRDVGAAPRIVVGRTGVGKSALLLELARREQYVSQVDPERLALNYLANSTILRRLSEIGVKLDIFYRLLWRHVLAVELIRLKYRLRTEDDQRSFLDRIRERFAKDKKKEEALQYLVQYGEHFWEDAEYRVHEVTTRLEQDVRAALKGKSAMLDAEIGQTVAQSDEERREIVHRLQEVVNATQIQKLSRVIDVLADEVFGDTHQRYYVTIDKLDEPWVEDQVRYRLIRALIETARELRKIESAKIVIALRRDLIERVFRDTRDAGFQEEKYQPLILRLYWGKKQLLNVIDRRINHLVARQYTKEPVSWIDVFPARIGKQDTGDYLVDRTMYRPRDIIQFVNCCIQGSVDRPDVTVGIIRSAETTYSTLRFRSLGDEWVAEQPNLLVFASMLKRRPPTFAVSDIVQADLDAILAAGRQRLEDLPECLLKRWSIAVYGGELDFEEFRRRLAKVFYATGLVGVRPDVGDPISWSYLEKDLVREASLSAESRLSINPMFYRVLATQDRGTA